MPSSLPPIRLCILVEDGHVHSLESSASCLRTRANVSVILAVLSGDGSGGRLRHNIQQRYHSEVRVAEPETLRRFGHRRQNGTFYTVFLPGGDWLSDDALAVVAERASQHGPDLIYFDEDRIDARGHLSEPRFKPDPSYEYLTHSDYVGDLLCIKDTTLSEYGGIDLTDYSSARYRIVLRAFSDSKSIEHVALPLYHARPRKRPARHVPVLRQHFKDKGEDVSINEIAANAYRVKRNIRDNPKVTIVIPFRDRPELLRQCLQSIISRTDYDNYEVLGVSNRSQSLLVYEVMQEFVQRDERIGFVEYNIPFNFSALVNHGVDHASGDYIVLMNNDITVINTDWLQALLEHGQREEIGVVGAKLLYPNDTIQHAGLSIQQSGYIAHLHKHYPSSAAGYMNRLICTQNVSAVTAALCLFSRQLHLELGGFDETRFTVALNDVDFCLRAISRGYSNVFTPHCLACHHESLSRGYEDTIEKANRFRRERETFAGLYKHLLHRADPYYNPNLDQHRDDFSY